MAIRVTRTAVGAGLLAAGALVALPAPAWAVGGTVQLVSGELVITTDSGGDTIYLADAGTSVGVGADKGMSLVGGAPCVQVNPKLVRCPKSAASSYDLHGSGSRDVVLADSMPLPGTVALGGGNDYVQVGRGGDDISGGTGVDDVAYNTRTGTVAVTMDDEPDDGEAGEIDNVRSDVERVFGGAGDDLFEGNSGSTQFYGMSGDDKFYGTVGAPDRYDGGPGFDEIDWIVPASVPLSLSLDEVANDGPAGQGDNLVNLEVVIGGAGPDTITGDDHGNWLLGDGGKDVLRGLGGADVLYATGNLSTMDGGAGDDDLRAWAGASKQLIGGTGTDLVTYFGYTSWDSSYSVNAQSPVTASINGAADDGHAGQKDNVHTDVENLAGTHYYADKLTGSPGPNKLFGFGGNDTLNGAGGSDVLLPQHVFGPVADSDVVSGGAGVDQVTYADETTAVVVTINGVANDGPAGDGDYVKTDVEQVRGGSGNDALSGSGAANLLIGGAGADVLRGNGGVDVLDGQTGADDFFGGYGVDTVTYEDRAADLHISLDGVVGDGQAGEGDNVATDVENVIGGSGDDDIVGTKWVNRIVAGSGDDRVAGGLGNDVIDLGSGDDVADGGAVKDGADKVGGGPGTDAVLYRQRTAPVTVVINASAGDGEAGENDLVQTDVETVVGGSGNDKLTGSTTANTLVGNDGSDTLNGGGGDDVIDPGYGADELIGGTGSDTADYGDRTADLFLTPDDLAHDGESGEKDQIRQDVENYIGGSGDDFILANFLDSVVHGGDGADHITGGFGNDKLYGEGGNDWIEGEGDVDFADGGAGIHDTCLTVESSVGCEHFS